MMAKCSFQSIDTLPLKSIDGLRHLAETRRFKGLGLQVVEDIEEAEFILDHSTKALGLPLGETHPTSLDDLEKILELCAAKKILMIVANLDYVTVEARALYVGIQKLGGAVRWMGKPDKVTGSLSLDLISKIVQLFMFFMRMITIAVGDSLHHDIKGANAVGIQSVFTTGGIHANELGRSSFGEVSDLSPVQTLSSKYDAHPSYVLPAFIW
ncbi:uncharacterized protein LOC123220812 [Mangifera indica]|uniref:uncharacterized protein LOC123220812 n=1 Tax=Mangifera indica TaxID=29780 RepID=UPI001CFADAA8|nr:uncharacterized protein LOC123220812 [Mangifera indica]